MRIFLILTFILIYPSLVFAAPRESDASEALTIVAYGKDSTGVLRALLTDSSGVVQVS